MGKELIKKHNFEASKANIERFSKNLPSNPSFDRVEVDGGLFGWGDHKVTGTEMNHFIGKVQDKLISVNGSLRSIIGEFKEVYNAFEFLDTEYINGIIGSVESAEAASQQALLAQEDIKKTVENLKKTVNALVTLKNEVSRINETVIALSGKVLSYDEISRKLDNTYRLSNLSGTINKLNDFSQVIEQQKEQHFKISSLIRQIEEVEHYKDIDTIWSDVKSHKENLAGLHGQLDGFIENVKQQTEKITADIDTLQQYRTLLETYTHLKDIDTVWNDVEGHKENLAGLHGQLDGFIENVKQQTEKITADIDALQQYRTMLDTYAHLKDIDTVWNDVESHKENLVGLHGQLDGFIENVKQQTEKITADIDTLQQYRTLLETYTHLKDIDTVWNDVEGHKENLAGLHGQLDGFIENVKLQTAKITADIDALQQYRTMLDTYAHLKDIDTVWNDVESHKENLVGLHGQLDGFIENVKQQTEKITADIDALQQYRTTLETYTHLKDIDTVWYDVESHKENLVGLHGQLDNFIKETNESTSTINSEIDSIHITSSERNLLVDKRIKIAYSIAGSAIAISIIQLILMLLGVL